MSDFIERASKEFIRFNQANEVRNHLTYSSGVVFSMNEDGQSMVLFFKVHGRYFQQVLSEAPMVAFIPDEQFIEVMEKFIPSGVFKVEKHDAMDIIYKAYRNPEFSEAIKPWFEGKTVICDYNSMS